MNKIKRNKYIATILLISILFSQNKMKCEEIDPWKIESSKELDEKRNQFFYRIIERYGLEKCEEYILGYPYEFWQYYNAVMSNASLKNEDKQVALEDFWVVMEYCSSFEEQLEKVSKREIKVDDSLCEEFCAEGFYEIGTNHIVLSSNASLETRSHENKHHMLGRPLNEQVLYLKNGNVSSNEDFDVEIYDYGISEAIASDLACMDYSLEGFTDVYLESNLALQGIYAIYGRDAFLTMYDSDTFLKQFYEELCSLNFSTDFIVSFFEHLNCLFISITSDDPLFLEYQIKERSIINVCHDLILIEEAKNSRSWKLNFNLQAAIYALIQPISLEGPFYDVVEDELVVIQAREDLKKLKENPEFLKKVGIEVNNCSSFKVVVESNYLGSVGDLNLSYQKVIENSKEPDHFFVSFEDAKVISSSSYNLLEKNCREKLMETYGIIDSKKIDFYLKYLDFFEIYEFEISNCSFLSDEEKKKLVYHFDDFVTLHFSFFDHNPSLSMMQSLFTNAMHNCENKKDVSLLFNLEDAIYQYGGQYFLEELKNYQILDYATQKFYIQNGILFDCYISAIGENPNFYNITLEDFQRIAQDFPKYLANHTFLLSMSEKECVDFIFEQLENCTLKEFQDFIKIKEEKVNVLLRELVP